MEYPAIPICIAAKSNIHKLQIAQSIALRSAANIGADDRRLTNEELHQRFNIEATNVRLYHLTYRIWHKLENLSKQLTQAATETQNITRYEHK